MKKKYKGVAIGAGYFSYFQYEAWNRIPEVEIAALCNSNQERATHVMETYGVPRHYSDYREMLDKEKPDFVDIITPPGTHLEMCKEAADRGIDIICQKPLAPTFEESNAIVDYVQGKVRFMVHENWRFQPWHREIKRLLNDDAIGSVHSMYFQSRMGDGWGKDAYIPRQPYFREYPKLLIYETGIHFIDTFRYLNGDIDSVYAQLRKLNEIIEGEDSGIMILNFTNGCRAIWDANRYNEPNFENSRYTFGHFLVEGFKGSIRLYPNGRLTIQKLGEPETEHQYVHSNVGFAGDCVYVAQRHFLDCLISGSEFETSGDEYLKSLWVQDMVYRSADSGFPVTNG